MKIFKSIKYLVLSIMLVSCEGFVTGIEEQDPTRATDADLYLYMSGMQLEYAGTLEGEMARLAGLWCGYFSGDDRQYISLYNYSVTAANFNSPWGNVYSFVLKQSRITQAKAALVNNRISLGIAQVVEAHIMGTAAALWGNIPYREAADVVQFPNPSYDSQTQIFNDLISLLDEAISNLSSGSGDNRGDFLGDGSTTTDNTVAAVNRFSRLAYSLKARYLLYQKDYAGALAAAQNGILNNADDVVLTHGTSTNQNRNIYYDFMENQRTGYMGATNVFLKSVMNGRNHAKTSETSRLQIYFVGGTGDPRTSSGGYFASNASFPLFTAIENLLIVAECEARLNGVTAGVNALNDARAQIGARFSSGTYTDFADADFANGGIENGDGIADVNALIREVQEEKYVSLYGQIEGFNEMRRTGNSLGVAPNQGAQLPGRFLYPQSEVNANSSTPDPIPGLFEATTMFQ